MWASFQIAYRYTANSIPFHDNDQDWWWRGERSCVAMLETSTHVHLARRGKSVVWGDRHTLHIQRFIPQKKNPQIMNLGASPLWDPFKLYIASQWSPGTDERSDKLFPEFRWTVEGPSGSEKVPFLTRFDPEWSNDLWSDDKDLHRGRRNGSVKPHSSEGMRHRRYLLWTSLQVRGISCPF